MTQLTRNIVCESDLLEMHNDENDDNDDPSPNYHHYISSMSNPGKSVTIEFNQN